MTKYRKLAAVLFAGSLVLAACGTTTTTSDDGARRHRAATEAPATEAPSTEAPADRGTGDRSSVDRGPGDTEAPGDDRGCIELGFGHGRGAGQRRASTATPDGTIGVTIPLTGVPEKKTIAWLECDVPTCAAYITPGFKAATEALGWDLKIIPMKSTDPGPAFQQAIDQGVDYIASTGLATAQYQAQLDAANAAGIGVLSCFGTDDPSPRERSRCSAATRTSSARPARSWPTGASSTPAAR